MVKAVVERVNQITQVYGVENVRSPRYQSQHGNEQFEQLLEKEQKKQKEHGIEKSTNVNLPDEYIQFVTYDMKPYMSWEIKNKMDIKG